MFKVRKENIHLNLEPVDGEEEVVDADGDGVPGGGRVTPTGGIGSTFTMNGAFSEVQDQSRSVGNEEHKNLKESNMIISQMNPTCYL